MTIDIAIIDSGINPDHPHVLGVAGGCTFAADSQGRPVRRTGFDDGIGHGTAIAGIFREKLPDARLWAVKIFERKLGASFAVLHAALAWAIEAKMNVIHLSLGTTQRRHRKPLEALCRAARENGSVVLAAARSHDDRIYPAALPSVIGVYWNRDCRPGDIVHHPDTPIQFGAWGQPRPLPGLDQRRNFHGSSFAVAHVSVRVAQLLADDEHADSAEVMRALVRIAKHF